MNIRLGLIITTSLWTAAMIVAAFLLPGKPDVITNDFSNNLLLGAISWLGIIVDSNGATLNIFVGISILVGPFWGLIVFKDFNKIVGTFAIIASGCAASWIATGTMNVFFMAGGILAPVVAAGFMIGFAASEARDAFIRANGGETDRERGWREQKERRLEEQRRRRQAG